MPADCLSCNKKVAKSAKAIRCAYCKEWCHTTCGGLEDEDYLFMTEREKFGFRWYCLRCMVDCDNKDSRGKAVEELKEKFMEMQSMVSTSMQMFGQRLDNVEEKCKTTSSQAQPVMQPVKFAEIVKKST